MRLLLAILALAGGPPDERLARSEALTTTPRATSPAAVSPAAARRQAAASALPLPRGGNFNGIRWEEAGGAISEMERRGVLEYNAACQWLRAWLDGREAIAERVFAQVPDWPQLRGTPAAAVLRSAPPEALAQDCRASLEREVEYARRLGLAPTS